MLLFVCLCVSFLSLQEYPMINTLSFVIGDRRGSWERKEAKKKYGGVEGYGCFSLGDRACCHGAGPPIGGSLVQSLNSADCFIIEKFFLSSCLGSHPLLLHPSFFFPPLSHLLHPLALLLTLKEADMLHKVYNECSSCHPVSFWHSYSFNISGSSVGGRIFHKSLHGAWGDKITLKSNIHLLEGS